MSAALLMSIVVSASPAVPAELGEVQWGRDYGLALKVAREKKLPILVLFTEVPGCSTVNGYARDTLSNAAVIDASKQFVRVAVFNNLGGDDAKVLARWKEPAWNNPVLRFIDADERELAPRLTHEGGTPALLERMAQVSGAKVSEVKASYSMGCFWEGEAALGSLPGVRSTHAGYEDGREVVQLTAESPEALKSIDAAARKRGYRPTSGDSFRISASDDKYYLQRSSYSKLSLTPTQQSRVNAALATGTDPAEFLSPAR